MISEEPAMSGYFDFAMSQNKIREEAQAFSMIRDTMVGGRYSYSIDEDDPIISFYDKDYDYDLSLTRDQIEQGYTAGDKGPSYGITQLPKRYYVPDDIDNPLRDGGLISPFRTESAQEARAYANYLDVQFKGTATDPKKESNMASQAFSNIGKGFSASMGAPIGKDYVVDLKQEYLGQVTDDYLEKDLLANIGFAGLASSDSARVRDVTGRGLGTREFSQSKSLLGDVSSLKTFQEIKDKQARKEELKNLRQGENPLPRIPPNPLVRYDSPAPDRSALLQQFLRAGQPSIYPEAYESFNKGGEAKQNLSNQINNAMPTSKFPSFSDVAENPDKYLKDPNSVKTAEETMQVFDHNKQILEMARLLPKPRQNTAVLGGVQGDVKKVTASGPAGFVDRPPEQLNEATTVADDVPLDVSEGTFIINAAAVEHAGSEDIKNMLLEAMQIAKRQGLDTPENVNTLDIENAVSLLVSRGEVVVPPLLAKVIGYDRLNKINNRGKKEVKKRLKENGQSPEAEAISPQPVNPAEGTAMAKGGESFIQRAYKTIPTNVRLLFEYLAGAESPITEKNFTEAELREMATAIEKQRGKNVDRETQLREMVKSNKPYKKLEQPKGLETLAEFFGTDYEPIYVDFKGDFVDHNFVKEIESNPKFKNGVMESAKNALESYETTRDTVTVGGKNYYRDDVYYPLPGYEGFVKNLQDPRYQVQTTLGEFKAKDTKDFTGYNITDEYNFNQGELGYDSNEDITLMDVWAERDRPQMMAELMARYLRPEGVRPVNINLERAQQPDAPTMTLGGSVSGQGSSGPKETNANLSAEVQGDSFIARPQVNYSKQKTTQEYPDGVIVNEKGKSIGFAMDGQMFLSDDKSIRAGFERQTTNTKGRVNLPEQYGGETIQFGEGSKMKRYSMGATFGPFDVDISKTQLPGSEDVKGGSVRYRFSENGDVTLEAMDDGRSGLINLNYRF